MAVNWERLTEDEYGACQMLMDADGEVCGLAAHWRYISTTPDHRVSVLRCEECRVDQLRRISQADQDEAYLDQHGYPPVDIAVLVMNLGRWLMKLSDLRVLNPPEHVVNDVEDSTTRRASWVLAWFRNRPLERVRFIDDPETFLNADLDDEDEERWLKRGIICTEKMIDEMEAREDDRDR